LESTNTAVVGTAERALRRRDTCVTNSLTRRPIPRAFALGPELVLGLLVNCTNATPTDDVDDEFTDSSWDRATVVTDAFLAISLLVCGGEKVVPLISALSTTLAVMRMFAVRRVVALAPTARLFCIPALNLANAVVTLARSALGKPEPFANTADSAPAHWLATELSPAKSAFAVTVATKVAVQFARA
jgi:hypothetical protein